MKIQFLERPSREKLLVTPLHLIARDFPETLAQFRAHGLSLQEWGDRRLRDLESPAGILEDLQASTAWRADANSE